MSMTLQELCDWHAKRAGWTQKIEGDFEDAKWCLHHHSQWDHPFPPTLDGADASFPPNWDWDRVTDHDATWWSAFPKRWEGEPYPSVGNTGDKIRDLYELSKLAWEQEAA